MIERRERHVRLTVQPLEPRRLLSLNAYGSTGPLDIGDGDLVPQAEVVSGVRADGGFVVAATLRNDRATQVSVKRYSPSGRQTGERIVLAAADPTQSGLNESVRLSDLATNAAGDSVVTYAHEIGNNADATFVVRIGRDGTAAAPVQLFAGAAGVTDSAASVAIDDAGNYFVAYRTDDGSVLHVAPFDADGQARGAPFVADSSSSTAVALGAADLVARADGAGVIFAGSDTAEVGDSNLHDLRFGLTSLTETVEFREITEGTITSPAIAVQPDGTFAIAYRHVEQNFLGLDEDYETNSFVQRYGADAVAIGDPVELAADSRAQAVRVSGLSLDTNGGLIAAFVTVHKSTQTFYLQQLDPQLATTSPPILVDSFTTAQPMIVSPMSVGVDANGAAVLSYFRRDVATGRGDVFLRRFTPQIAGLDGTTLFAFGTDDADAMYVQRRAGSFVVWRQLTSRRFDASLVEQIVISGFAGDDLIQNVAALRATILGGDGDDSINGGAHADSIFGGRGDDRVTANDGNDTIHGQAGADTLFGNAHDDRLLGGPGADMLTGGPDTDVTLLDSLDLLRGIETILRG